MVGENHLVGTARIFILLGEFHASFYERPAKDIFDLTIQAAKLFVGPTLQGIENLRVDSQQEWFAWH